MQSTKSYTASSNTNSDVILTAEPSKSIPVTYGKSNKTFDLIITSLLISLVFVATFFINIRLPIAANGGLVHLGSGMLFIVAIMFGPKKGAIAGAVGMALFDLFSGWTLWAPFTLVARGVQGYIVGKIAWSGGRKGKSPVFNVVAIISSVPFMLLGYYVCERVLYGSWVIPLASIPGNLVQNFVGMLIAIPACLALKKLPLFK
ncbi:ECF transporter S component [Solibacillus sp. R5-41]|uniref:ECF transporter S component n=1 Tax=Solibacillus sp. R5-41 TaxID=2048654 RepID=UPI000C127528|nr:ECF transporter S component [Solibacillus sp. R5-41]ATP41377.1 ECF transporter S component [Solibacillus sp. R5-41]